MDKFKKVDKMKFTVYEINLNLSTVPETNSIVYCCSPYNCAFRPLLCQTQREIKIKRIFLGIIFFPIIRVTFSSS